MSRYRPEQWHLVMKMANLLRGAIDTEDGALVKKLEAQDLHALGEELRKVAAGIDAREVFRQRPKKGNSSTSIEAYDAATAYWHGRLEDPAADDAPAVKAAQLRYVVDPPSADRIRRIARQYRERALKRLEGWQYSIDESGLNQAVCRMDHDTTALRKYLKLKSPHFRD